MRGLEVQLKKVVTLLQEKIEGDLVGVYLHGSLAMGCFNPQSSDIDLLAVTKGGLSEEKKRAVGETLIDFQKTLSHKLEISVITLFAAKSLEYPTPHELHFPDESGGFILGGFNSDLIAHFMITKKRGVCLFGEKIEDVFSDVPHDLYLKAIAHDTRWSFDNVMNGQDVGVCRVPSYAVLNCCRTLAYLKDGFVASKKEGGEWGLKNLSGEYRNLIKEALCEYEEKDSSRPVDAVLLKQFITHCQSELDSELKTLIK